MIVFKEFTFEAAHFLPNVPKLPEETSTERCEGRPFEMRRI